jgi:hypothetical protein
MVTAVHRDSAFLRNVVGFPHTTWCYNLDDRIVHGDRSDNLRFSILQ